MKRTHPRLRAAGAVLALGAFVPCALGAPPDSVPIAAVGLERSRFGADLGRELEASAFHLVRFELKTASWRALVPAARDAGARWGVAFDGAGERVVLFSLRGAVRVERELVLDTHDELARRRQWIALVEHLRALDQQDETAGPVAAVARATSPERARVASPAAPTGGSAVPDRDRWLFGAAATVGYDPVVSSATSHIVFVAEWPLYRQLDMRAQVFWPLLGSRQDAGGAESRSWTFGGRGGLHARLRRDPFAALQPFVGLTLGLEVVMVETYELQGGQTSVEWIPSALVGAIAGVRLRVARRAHLLAQVEAGDAVPLAAGPFRPYEKAAADAHFAHGALGLLFDF